MKEELSILFHILLLKIMLFHVILGLGNERAIVKCNYQELYNC